MTNSNTDNTVCYNGLTFVPFITHEQIQARINEIAEKIAADYGNKCPLFLCVLTGAFPFAADLFRQTGIDSEISFIRLKSYQGTQTSGKVKELIGLTEDIKDRHVIVVEDIVDTGHTISHLLDDLRSRQPASLRVATLLFKPESEQYGVKPDYVGFNIPPAFIIGFGLDLDGKARNLRDIYVVADNGERT